MKPLWGTLRWGIHACACLFILFGLSHGGVVPESALPRLKLRSAQNTIGFALQACRKQNKPLEDVENRYRQLQAVTQAGTYEDCDPNQLRILRDGVDNAANQSRDLAETFRELCARIEHVYSEFKPTEEGSNVDILPSILKGPNAYSDKLSTLLREFEKTRMQLITNSKFLDPQIAHGIDILVSAIDTPGSLNHDQSTTLLILVALLILVPVYAAVSKEMGHWFMSNIATTKQCHFCTTTFYGLPCWRYPTFDEDGTWECPECEAHNGFDGDDYDYRHRRMLRKPLPKRVSRTGVTRGTKRGRGRVPKLKKAKSITHTVLCKVCIKNQEMKEKKVREYGDNMSSDIDLNSDSTEDWERQIRRFKNRLERQYPLCVTCSRNKNRHLTRVNSQVAGMDINTTTIEEAHYRFKYYNSQLLKLVMSIWEWVNEMNLLIPLLMGMLIYMTIYRKPSLAVDPNMGHCAPEIVNPLFETHNMATNTLSSAKDVPAQIYQVTRDVQATMGWMR